MLRVLFVTGGPFLEGPEKPYQNLKPSKMKRGSLPTILFRPIYLSVIRYRLTKNGFADTNVSGGFEIQAPGDTVVGYPADR